MRNWESCNLFRLNLAGVCAILVSLLLHQLREYYWTWAGLLYFYRSSCESHKFYSCISDAIKEVAGSASGSKKSTLRSSQSWNTSLILIFLELTSMRKFDTLVYNLPETNSFRALSVKHSLSLTSHSWTEIVNNVRNRDGDCIKIRREYTFCLSFSLSDICETSFKRVFI